MAHAIYFFYFLFLHQIKGKNDERRQQRGAWVHATHSQQGWAKFSIPEDSVSIWQGQPRKFLQALTGFGRL